MMIEDDYGATRDIVTYILEILRNQDLPSLQSAVQSQATNISNAFAGLKFITQEPSSLLTNEQALSTLSSGYLKNTTSTGVLSVQTTPIPGADGGTGITSYTIGDLLYASGATTLAKLADVATGNALISGGVGVAPSWGKIGLTTHISGILGSANGGTGIDNGGRTLTINTNSGALTFGSAGLTLTIAATGTAAVGTGTTNQLAYWSGTNTLTGNSGLTFTSGSFTVDIATGAAATSGQIRIGHVATTDYLRLIHVSQSQMSIDKFASAGQAIIDVNPRPGDGTSAASFRFFRSVTTTGATGFDIFLGDGSGTFNHRIFGQGGHTQMCLNNGALLVGRSSGLTGTGDLDVNGNFRCHGSSASGAQSVDMGALAGAAAGWETNAQTNINAIRTCLRNHGLMA